MSIRSQIARQLGRLSKWALTTFTSGGSSLPGKLAASIDPNILTHLSKNYDVAIITGTNGKTLTTSLAVQALKERYSYILTNPTGSNMQQGIVSTFLSAPSLPKGQRGLAILEVDEGSLKHVVKQLQPIIFVHTNVFEDQMDRFGDVNVIYQLMADAALEVPDATIITNADSPMLNSIKLPNPRKYFGFAHESDELERSSTTEATLCPHCNHPLTYHLVTYANQGDYMCENCGFKRPTLDYKVTSLDDLSISLSTFHIDDFIYSIPVAGLYNIYNALAAYSLARFFELTPAEIEQGFSKSNRVFGRQEILEINNKKVLINLVKNPVGLNQVIALVGLDKEPFTLITILNNNYADGKDISWIWEGDFESMAAYPIHKVYTAGAQKDEMTKRLTEAKIVSQPIIELNSMGQVIETVENSETDHIHILATYTAMLDLRKELTQAGYIN